MRLLALTLVITLPAAAQTVSNPKASCLDVAARHDQLAYNPFAARIGGSITIVDGFVPQQAAADVSALNEAELNCGALRKGAS